MMYKIINDKRPSRAVPHVLCLAAIAILLGLAQAGYGQKKTTQKETKKMEHVNGTFDVKTLPQKTDNPEAESAKLGRMSLDKQFNGPLEGVSKGEMIYIGTDVEGSGGYVAIERITGKLRGRSGSFALLHVGVMTRNAPNLTVTVLPDSGTGELVGLTGKMNIKIEGGKHFYEFEYELP
jgi:Protein of unknown function (DUF3224)